MVLTDILKRWQVLQGKKALLCTGTDEHGMKVEEGKTETFGLSSSSSLGQIQQAAAKAGSEPKPFCDKGAEVFKTLALRAEIANDYFVRTTDLDHRETVQFVWHMLRRRGYIYQSKHEGWYCVSDETFYPQSGVHLIVEPPTGRKIMASIETGKEVEWTSESNYHFRLSAFKDRLLQFYQDNPGFVVPQSRLDEVVRAVESGLQDLSISRPAERLSWGIPVPDDPSQTIYVWVDALMNYITKAGYPWTPGEETVGGWPADCQVIGKEIVRFHCVYWPAFLMALDLPPPHQILTHAHWTLGRQKMSKSTGNVVNPFFAIDRFGVDVMRYYLAHDGGISQDADYSNYYIIERYKKGLQNSLGNLVSRITRGKKWSVREAVGKAKEVDIAGGMDKRQWHALRTLPCTYRGYFDALDVGGALKAVMELVYETNRYMQATQPWDLVARTPATEKESHETSMQVNRIIYLSSEALRLAGILLQPYMPNKAAQLLDMLGVAEERRSWQWAEVGKDKEYGDSKVELGKGTMNVLFPPLSSDM